MTLSTPAETGISGILQIHESCVDQQQGHTKSDDVADFSQVALMMEGFEGRAKRALAMPQCDSIVVRVEADVVAGADAATSMFATKTAWGNPSGAN